MACHGHGIDDRYASEIVYIPYLHKSAFKLSSGGKKTAFKLGSYGALLKNWKRELQSKLFLE